MPDNIDRYLPEYDEEGMREQLEPRTRQELIDMLIGSYKRTQLWGKLLGEQDAKLSKIRAIAEEPSKLLDLPNIPGPNDLHRMFGE